MLVHSGRHIHFGHYYSYSRVHGNTEAVCDDTWVKFNDFTVTSMSGEAMVQELHANEDASSYVLLYRTTAAMAGCHVDADPTDAALLREIDSDNKQFLNVSATGSYCKKWLLIYLFVQFELLLSNNCCFMN